MATTIRFEDSVEIPLNIRSLADFRRWATSDAFPEQGRIDYVAGSIEVDMSPEDLHTHGKLKTELVAVLWQRIKRTVSSFLLGLWRDGALFGATPEQAFYVKCDAETNPNEVVDAGQLVVEIGLAPVKPAEFVIFRIGQMAAGGGVDE